MNQLQLSFAAYKLARKFDPETSLIAAKKVNKFGSGHCRKILDALIYPMTAHELESFTELSNVQICRRLSDLEKAGLAEPTGDIRKLAERQERVWRKVGS